MSWINIEMIHLQ